MSEPVVILVCDDNDAGRYTKVRPLKHAGYTVLEAATGGEALRLMAEHRPPLAVMDVKLPDISGLEVTAAIKRDYPGTFVLQTSASFVGVDDRVRGLEEGADSYLIQPMEPRELLAGVRALLRISRSEAALQDLNATLERRVAERTAELTEANARLLEEGAQRERVEDNLRQAQKMEAVGQLTGGIAHDFNNLLTGITGNLELLQRRLSAGRNDVGRYADAAMTAATRAAALTQRLLAFARRQSLDPKPVEVNKLVASMEDLLRQTVGEQVTVEVVLAGGLWTAHCDAHQLENALLNLVINARDAMPDGGRVTVETANTFLDDAYAATQDDLPPGQYVVLCVTDTGTGMPPEVVERAFDPFFTTKPIGQGTGLGLSMLYGFVKQSGGHVRIYSEPGQGTTLKLYLPRFRGAAASPKPSAASPDMLMATAGETVLVVEDETMVRLLVLDVLADLNYAALEADDGPAALRILESDARIDLLLTDVGLPGMNGRQLADRARELRPGLRVLFVTGYAHNAAIGNGLLDPGMEVISKPFALDALTRKVGAMVGER